MLLAEDSLVDMLVPIARAKHMQGRMVLLAEDNLINQRVAKMMLSSLGMTVEVVSNGQEAVDAVKRRLGRDDVCQFDVLLMDMAMPVMGGVDATKVNILQFSGCATHCLHCQKHAVSIDLNLCQPLLSH